MSATMTSTVLLSEILTQTSSIMIPGASSDLEGDNRVVRFDDECILIPDRSKRPKVLSKSYTLPLWKKKQALSDSDTEVAPTPSGALASPEDTRIVLKVPIPRYVGKRNTGEHKTQLSLIGSFLNLHGLLAEAGALLRPHQRLNLFPRA